MSFPTSAVVDATKHLLALCNNGNMIWSATNKTANNQIASNGEQVTTATIFSPRQSGLAPLRCQPHGDVSSPLFKPETATRNPPFTWGVEVSTKDTDKPRQVELIGFAAGVMTYSIASGLILAGPIAGWIAGSPATGLSWGVFTFPIGIGLAVSTYGWRWEEKRFQATGNRSDLRNPRHQPHPGQ